jgi:glycosyltransferase involved in cell wall biosynthesis
VEKHNTESRLGRREVDHDEFDVSIIIPAYNEEKSISDQVAKVKAVMDKTDWRYNVIVVDDGSTDDTAEVAAELPVDLIRLPRNSGYGAALKTGTEAAAAEYIVFIDADGTYPADAIPALLSKMSEYDMAVGARIGENTHIPLVRKPAKWFLQKLASYLAGQNIPDLNSGLRVIKKPLLEKFSNILPSGFSLTTTITLALLCNNYFVYYHPIDYFKRVGESKIRPVEAYNFFLLILRTIVYFNPLKVFLPLGAVFFLAGSIKLIYDIFKDNLSESAVMGILSAFIIWAIGLLSDQISKLGIGK